MVAKKFRYQWLTRKIFWKFSTLRVTLPTLCVCIIRKIIECLWEMWFTGTLILVSNENSNAIIFIFRWEYIFARGVGACPLVYQSSVEKLSKFIEIKEAEAKIKIKLSCGHVDDNLESIYLKKFADLLKNINSGSLQYDSCSFLLKSFSNEDRSLIFQFRRFRFLDVLLVPVFKIYFYVCSWYS